VRVNPGGKVSVRPPAGQIVKFACFFFAAGESDIRGVIARPTKWELAAQNAMAVLQTPGETVAAGPASSDFHVTGSAKGPSCYRLRLAQNGEDVLAALRLRYRVFSLELNEGQESAHQGRYETDEFDELCDHLIVEHGSSGAVVGTYRLQTGLMAAQNRGYYSAREFDFSVYEGLRESMLELGRACIHRDHRSFDVLSLLWHGIADYAQERKARYLVGCSSLTSQSAEEGFDAYRQLQPYLAEESLRTSPVKEFRLSIEVTGSSTASVKLPRLLRAYLSIGARVCGEPAIDRDFKTIDFLTLLDLENLPPVARARFLGRAQARTGAGRAGA
jgi:putative hemolysin